MREPVLCLFPGDVPGAAVEIELGPLSSYDLAWPLVCHENQLQGRFQELAVGQVIDPAPEYSDLLIGQDTISRLFPGRLNVTSWILLDDVSRDSEGVDPFNKTQSTVCHHLSAAISDLID